MPCTNLQSAITHSQWFLYDYTGAEREWGEVKTMGEGRWKQDIENGINISLKQKLF